MHAMYEKYRVAAFGRCPHVFCQGQPVLPVGLSDMPRNYTVNVFCPRCHGLYFPKSTRQANVDGAYFGTTFPHLYLMTHPVRPILAVCCIVRYLVSILTVHFLVDLLSQDMIPPKPNQSYFPRVFGFRVNQASLYYTNREEDARAHQQRQGEVAAGRQSRRSRRLHGAAGIGVAGASGPPSASFSLTSGASTGILSGGAVGAGGTAALAMHGGGGGGANSHPRR
jgi:casein kinase II subunit beta